MVGELFRYLPTMLFPGRLSGMPRVGEAGMEVLVGVGGSGVSVAVAAGGNVSDGGGKVAVSARVGADEAVAGSSEVGVLYSTEKMAVRVRSGVLVRNGVGGETRGRLQAASKTTAMSPTILRSFLNGNIHFSSISRQIITVLYYRTFNTCHSSQMRV